MSTGGGPTWGVPTVVGSAVCVAWTGGISGEASAKFLVAEMAMPPMWRHEPQLVTLIPTSGT